MSYFTSLRAVALAGVCLAPLAALAQDEPQNEVDVGTRYQSQTSPVFGRYNGQTNKGFSSTGDFSLKGGDAWDSGDTWYYRLTGTDIGYNAGGKLGPEASLDFKFGQQGSWGFDVYYDAISYAGNTIMTPFQSTGQLVKGIAAYGSGGASSPFYSSTTATSLANTAAVKSLLVSTDTGLRRDIVGGSAKYRMSDWTFSTEVRHEHKEGTLEETAYGFVSNAAFPNPINYDTDRYNAKLAYATAALQGQLSLTYSKFTDNNSGLTLQSPYYSATTPTHASTVYSAAPSNDAVYVNGQIGLMLSPESRLTGSFRYGIEMQDSNLPAVAGSDGLGVTKAGALNLTPAGYLSLNPQGLGAVARVYGVNAAFDTSLIDHLNLHLGYILDGRDVDTSSYGIYGSGTASATAISSIVAYSIPQTWLKQKINAEADYRILPNTKLTLGYTYNDTDRSFSQVDKSTESVGNIKLASAMPSWALDGSVSYSHGDRSAIVNVGIPWTFSGDTAAEAAASYPSLAFYQAPRLQDVVKLRTNYHGIDDIDIGIIGSYTENRYTAPSGIVGTNNDRNASIGPDIGYSPSPDASYHLFYTYEQVYYDNRGAGSAMAANGYGWTAATTDSVHTIGLAADWKFSEKLKVGFDYTYYYGDVSYYLWDGISASTKTTTYTWQNVQNLPDVTSSMHNLTMHGTYSFTPNLSVWLGYQYQMMKDNDWAYNGWSSVTKTSATANTILSGVANPSDHANVIQTKLMFKF